MTCIWKTDLNAAWYSHSVWNSFCLKKYFFVWIICTKKTFQVGKSYLVLTDWGWDAPTLVVVQEHDWAALSCGLSSVYHRWDEGECRVQTRSYQPTSVADLNRASAADCRNKKNKPLQQAYGKSCGKSYLKNSKQCLREKGEKIKEWGLRSCDTLIVN